MKVTLLGDTRFHLPDRIIGTAMYDRLSAAYNEGIRDADDADLVAEVAGRLCYDSFHLPNEKTATNKGYLDNINMQRHFSVEEHASATFLVEGVSRSLLMEMRTHRHGSFSARSTRYVDERETPFVVPPTLRPHINTLVDSQGDWTVGQELNALMEHAQHLYETLYEFLVSEGATRKEAREAAREVLPGMTQTEFVVSANHHAWRDILSKRLAPGAAIEIRELNQEILRQLKRLAPNIYQDIEVAC